MAVCRICGREMLETDSCDYEELILKGVHYRPLPWEGPGRCPDCNVALGGFHHPGCDREICPRCGGQLITCGCLKEDER